MYRRLAICVWLCLAAIFGELGASAAVAGCPGRSDRTVATLYYPPITRLRADQGQGQRTYKIEVLSVGDILIDGRNVAVTSLPEELKAIVQEGHSRLALDIAANARFGTVTKLVRAINDVSFCDYQVIGAEAFLDLDSRTTPIQTYRVPAPPSFGVQTNALIAIIFAPVRVNKRSSRPIPQRALEGCHTFDNLTEVSLADLLRNLSKRLKYVLDRNPKFDQNTGEFVPPPIFQISAIVQADHDTPWRCIAGPIAAAQYSGYPAVDLVAN